jgi:hypothetical protein
MLLHFPNYVGISNMFTRIHPLKQKQLLHFLQNLPNNVEDVYVFGSALNLSCWNESDLDLLIIGQFSEKEQCQIHMLAHKYPEDVDDVDTLFATKSEYLTSCYETNHVYNEVLESGLKVYMKGRGIIE